MPRLLHAAKRRLRFRQRVDLGGQWRPLGPGQPVRHLAQQATNTLGLLKGNRVQGNDLVGDVGTSFRHLLRRPDVALGDLGETAVLRSGPHGRFDEPLIRQAVEHHIDAGTVSVSEDLVSEIRVARVVNVFHTQLA